MPRSHLLAAALLLAGVGAASAEEQRSVPAVTVTGEGVVSVAPDIAIVTCAVLTDAPTAEAALKANAASTTKALAALNAAGVADRDVQTSGISLEPQYDYGDGANRHAPKLVSYRVRNALTIRSRAIDALGPLLDRLTAAGANQIEGLAFDVSERAARLDQARKDAIADARRKAELYAAGAGARLGDPLEIDEEADEAPIAARPFAARAKALEAAPATPVAKGEEELRARVTVRWALAR